MLNPRLAARYAKSLLDLALERGELEQVYADMKVLQVICKGNADFVALLRSPVIKNETKRKIVEAVTAGKIGVTVNSFNRLLITKNREGYLPEVIAAFIQQYKNHNDIYTVQLTTAVPASEALKTQILDHLRNTTPMKKIELETKVNEDILGGFVIQVGDKLVDASVAYDLREVARQFENNDFIYKVR
ncbi:MAG: ATP synthase F1 subunit delta [Chitinophagaceae bacterium]|nr:ATP synthase F1 subunit delta [Chitinophagaceae bacterium]